MVPLLAPTTVIHVFGLSFPGGRRNYRNLSFLAGELLSVLLTTGDSSHLGIVQLPGHRVTSLETSVSACCGCCVSWVVLSLWGPQFFLLFLRCYYWVVFGDTLRTPPKMIVPTTKNHSLWLRTARALTPRHGTAQDHLPDPLLWSQRRTKEKGGMKRDKTSRKTFDFSPVCSANTC